MLKKLGLSALLGATLLGSTAANAHIVGLGWTFETNGDVTFDALHWHGQHGTAGALIVNGTSYNFTSVTHNTATMTGLDGALVNSTYSSYDGAGTLTALGTFYPVAGGPVDDWLHVTVSGLDLSSGSLDVTATTGPGGLTSWTLDNSITTTVITVPPTTSVSEPASLALLGLGLLGLGAARRKAKA